MKKIVYKIFISLLLTSFIGVSASTRVNTRTEGNYLVPSDVIITESNKKAILGTPSINASEKIYDFADLLSDKQEETLYKQINRFIDGTGIDYAVVTIDKNNKDGLREYARDFYSYNDFLDDGILLLIDRDYNGIYMTTVGKAVELFPDSRMEPILKNVFNLTKEGKFYEACKSFTISIGEFVQIGLATDDEGMVKVSSDGKIKVFKNLHLFDISVFSLVGTVIIILLLVLRSKITGNKFVTINNYLNKDTMKIVNISEVSLGKKTFKKLISEKKENHGDINQEDTVIK